MIRLVVNAEEFGQTPGSNDDILRAHRQGIVTSTAVAGASEDLTAAVAALRTAPDLGVGLSFCLTGPGARPVSRREDVPSLVAADGTFRATSRLFAFDWLKGAISVAEVEREMETQLVRARDAGLAIDHLCTRGNVGFLPGIGQLMERLARRHKIAGIRSTVETPTLGWVMDPARGLETSVLAGLSWLTRRRLGPLRHGPRTWGYVESGRLDEVRILEIIGRLAPGAHELICHPSLASHPSHPSHATIPGVPVELGDPTPTDEWRALTSSKVKTALERRGIVLCRWRDLF